MGSLGAFAVFLYPLFSLFWVQGDLLNHRGYYVGHDFVNYWTGARLAWEGRLATLYDIGAYNALLRSWFAPMDRFMIFSYPPHALLPLLPLAALPYLAAQAIWTVGGIAVFLKASLGNLSARGDKVLLAAIVLSPVVLNNVVFGQAGLWLAALFVAVFKLLPTRPIAAGALLGLLTIKPQLGLVLPIVLVALGCWRAIGAAIVSGIVLAAVSVVLFGIEPWQAYVQDISPRQWQFVWAMKGFYTFVMCSPYAAFWWLGLPAPVALALHGIVSVGILGATVLAVRGPAAWSLKVAIVAFAAVLVTPYVITYDLAIPLAALLWHLSERKQPLDRLQDMALFVLWLSAFMIALYVQPTGVALGAFAVMAMFAALAREALAQHVLRKLAPT